MAHNCCQAPCSKTLVFNYSLAATQFAQENFTVDGTLLLTLANIPAAGFFIVFLDTVYQKEGINFTVDYLNGIVTLIGANAGQEATCVYIKS